MEAVARLREEAVTATADSAATLQAATTKAEQDSSALKVHTAH